MSMEGSDTIDLYYNVYGGSDTIDLYYNVCVGSDTIGFKQGFIQILIVK